MKRKNNSMDVAFRVATSAIAALAIILLLLILTKSGMNASNVNGSTTVQAAAPYPYISRIKNLTSEYLYNSTGGNLYSSVVINMPLYINVSASPVTAASGQSILINITYFGVFNFMRYNSTAYVKNVINIRYFGFHQNGSYNMLVFNNRPNVSRYFRIAQAAHDYTPAGRSVFNYSAIGFNIIPTDNASNKTWLFCGGEFLAYANNTNWNAAFDNITFERLNVDNHTFVNLLSPNCARVFVG